MLEQVWAKTKKGPPNPEARDKLVTETMSWHDTDRSGSLNLEEFSNLICEKHHWSLLPPHIVDQLRGVWASPMKGGTPEKPVPRMIWEGREQPPAVVVLTVCKDLFFASGPFDLNGALEEEACGTLLSQVWSQLGRPVRSVEQLQVKESVRKALRRVGKSEGGGLLFHEFMMILTAPPWRREFPIEIQNQLPMLVLKEAQNLPDHGVSEEAGREQGEALIEAARSLFESSDTSGNGEIDEEELASLMQKVCQKLGRPLGDVRHRLVEEVREHMLAFDKDASGGLSFHEFLRMLTRKPWRELLPPQVQVHLPLLVQGVISPQKEPRKDTALPAIVVLTAARELFIEFDMDRSGELEEQELLKMCEQVWHRLGRAVTVSLRDEVRDAMLVFDKNGSGGIDFVEFVRLVARRPWKVLLRADAQEALKHIALADLQEEAKKQGGA